jgi:hypothetical protein
MTEESFEQLLGVLWNDREGEQLRPIGDQLRTRLARYLAVALPHAESIDMNTHTERMNRLLLLWLELQKAVASAAGRAARATESKAEIATLPPWTSPDENVRKLWTQITHPRNHRALEEWLYQAASGETELWAQAALAECRRRNG